MRPEMSNHRKRVVIAAASLLVLGLGYVTVLRATKEFKQTDLTVYLAAATSVLRGGEDLYQVTNERGWNYVYPPLFAIIMVPFAKMPLFWASLAWYVLSLILAAGAVHMCVAMMHHQWSDRPGFLLYALPPCLVGWPLIVSLARGQASVLLLWLVTASLFYSWKGRDILGGTLLAGAVTLKVFPLSLLGYFLWRRRWGFVTATCSGIVLGTVVLPAAVFGWNGNLTRLREWVTIIAKPALNIAAEGTRSPVYAQLLNPMSSRNQSLLAVLSRLTEASKASKIAAGIAVGMMVTTLLAGRRRGAQNEQLIVSAVLAWMLLIPPVSENHYFVLLLMPLTALVCLAAHTENPLAWWTARGAVVLFAMVNILGKAIEYYGPLCWGTLMLWAALLTTASWGALEAAAGMSQAPARRTGVP